MGPKEPDPDPEPQPEHNRLRDLVGQVAILEGKIDELAEASAQSARRGGTGAVVVASVALVLAAGLVLGTAHPALTAAVAATWGSVVGAAPPPPARAGSQPASPERQPARAWSSPASPERQPAIDASPDVRAESSEPVDVMFIRDFYRHLPADTSGAFGLLTPEFQRKSGGLIGYRTFYQDLASVTIVGEPTAVDQGHVNYVSATIRFIRRGGAVSTERFQFTLSSSADGKIRLSGSTRLP